MRRRLLPNSGSPEMPQFRRDAVRVVVPATSANLGAGFDSVGLALGVYDELIAMVSDDQGVLVEIAGEGADTVPRDERNLVAAVMLEAFDALGGRPPGFVLRCVNAVPHGRGLGSSAAARIGGLVLARGMVEGGDELLPDAQLLDLANAMEGHPDNVAAALHGGFTIAWTQDGVAHAVRRDAHPDIVPVVCVPDTELSTAKARGLLGESVARADAAFNVSRAALLVHAMTQDPSMLMSATDDRLHQQQREHAYPQSLALVRQLRADGHPAMISGAGPSVIVLSSKSIADTIGVPDGWAVATTSVDVEGARVLPLA